MPIVISFCAEVTSAFSLAQHQIDEDTNKLEAERIFSIEDQILMLGQTTILSRIVIYEE